MFELKNHGKLAAIGIGVQARILRRGAPCLPYRYKSWRTEGVFAHLTDILVQMRAVHVHAEGRVFSEVVDYVKPKAPDALIDPEANHIVKLLPQERILPVKVRLFNGKLIIVILSQLRHKLPGGAAELRKVGLNLRRVAPDVVIVVRVITALFRLQKPWVLVRGVVQNEIHDDTDIPCLRLGNEPFAVGHRAEQRVYVPVVRYAISRRSQAFSGNRA